MPENSALADEIIALVERRQANAEPYPPVIATVLAILDAKDAERRSAIETIEAMYLRRVDDLLTHNNALLERARVAEALAADRLQALLAAARVGAALAEAIGGKGPQNP